ncbi:MAG: class I SAM-dependent methyltransferase [Candidatus Handelsmanbacteria bacterium]|nr:class I SAM-dependent methyltransferase [Candidatus Handelsmanbacteria bacterium]
MTETSSNGQRLRDYREHYRADAESIPDPQALPPTRRASESRRFEALVRLLGLREGERVLDLGCGSGWLAEHCRRRGARVWAADLALRGVAGAKARFPLVDQYLVADVYHPPFAGGSFDAVVLSEVAEHLEDLDRAFGEVARLLRPGGRLLVSVPYRETIVEHLCIHCNRPTPANAHLHSFDEDRLAGCLRRQGLELAAWVLLNNKALELAGVPRLTQVWPYWAWRGLDRLGIALLGRAAFLGMLAGRPA